MPGRNAASLRRVLERCHARGVPVAFLDGWEDRGYQGRDANGPPKGGTTHHTAGPRVGDNPSFNFMAFDSPIAPLCHVTTARSGRITAIAAKRANHAGKGEFHGVTDGNGWFIGNEVEDDGDGNITEEQKRAIAVFNEECMAEWGFGLAECHTHANYAMPRGRKTDININGSHSQERLHEIIRGYGGDGGDDMPTAEEIAKATVEYALENGYSLEANVLAGQDLERTMSWPVPGTADANAPGGYHLHVVIADILRRVKAIEEATAEPPAEPPPV